MSKSSSKISGGGHRTTEHVKSSDLFGSDASYVKTNDYSSSGKWTSGTKTDANGNIWSVDSTGCTVEIIGNDGRND